MGIVLPEPPRPDRGGAALVETRAFFQHRVNLIDAILEPLLQFAVMMLLRGELQERERLDEGHHVAAFPVPAQRKAALRIVPAISLRRLRRTRHDLPSRSECFA